LGTTQNQPVTVEISKLLANDVDLEGRTLAFTSAGLATTQGGSLTVTDTDITYMPRLDFTGYDSFTYSVVNGAGGSALGTVFVFVAPAALPSGNLVGIQMLSNGRATIRFAGIPGLSYAVEASQDLVGWTRLGTAPAGPNGIISLDDPQAGLFNRRFYRTVPQQ
jgi:hypothetical protein